MPDLYVVDWAATGAMISGLAGLVGAGAVLWAAWQGKNAVSDWRAQKLIERRLDTGERALTAAYRAKSALETIRSNIMTGSELSRAEEDLEAQKLDLSDQPKERARRIKFVQAYYRRVNLTQEDWDEVFAVIPIVKAYFGDEMSASLWTLAKQKQVVIVAAECYIDDADGTDRDFTRKLRAEIFRGRDGEDPIAQAVDEEIKKLEGRLLPLLRDDVADLDAADLNAKK